MSSTMDLYDYRVARSKSYHCNTCNSDKQVCACHVREI